MPPPAGTPPRPWREGDMLYSCRIQTSFANIRLPVLEKIMPKFIWVALLFVATPAVAGDEPDKTDAVFQTPSKNIVCVHDDASSSGVEGSGFSLFCSRFEPAAIFVSLDKTGVKTGKLESDLGDEEPVTLEYGEHWRGEGGFDCYSSKTGLMCEHPDFGGFEISRKGVKKLR
jgi:hypothetical protein